MTTLVYDHMDPNLEPIMKSGVTGLYLTLKASEKEDTNPFPEISWEIKGSELRISYDCSDEEAFMSLAAYTYQFKNDSEVNYHYVVNSSEKKKAFPKKEKKTTHKEKLENRQGVLYCPALHNSKSNLRERLFLHKRMTSTVWSNPRTAPSVWVTGVTEKSGDEYVVQGWKELYVEDRPRQIFFQHSKRPLFDKKGNFQEEVSLNASYMLGAEPRFPGEEAWAGHGFLAALFFWSPIGALSFRLPVQRQTGLVFLDYLNFRQIEVLLKNTGGSLGVCSNAEDAFLQSFYLTSKIQALEKRFGISNRFDLYVVGKEMGGRTITVVDTVRTSPTPEMASRYKVCSSFKEKTFLNKVKINKNRLKDLEEAKKKGFNYDAPPEKVSLKRKEIKPSPFKARIARNIVENKSWYLNLEVVDPSYKENLIKEAKWSKKKKNPKSITEMWSLWAAGEKKEMIEVLKNMPQADVEREFVDLFHKALKSKFASIAEQKKSRGGSVSKGFKDFREDFLRKLNRSHSRDKLMEVLLEVFGFLSFSEDRQRLYSNKLLSDPHGFSSLKSATFLALMTYH